jgi:hypothetical protein
MVYYCCCWKRRVCAWERLWIWNMLRQVFEKWSAPRSNGNDTLRKRGGKRM